MPPFFVLLPLQASAVTLKSSVGSPHMRVVHIARVMERFYGQFPVRGGYTSPTLRDIREALMYTALSSVYV